VFLCLEGEKELKTQKMMVEPYRSTRQTIAMVDSMNSAPPAILPVSQENTTMLREWRNREGTRTQSQCAPIYPSLHTQQLCLASRTRITQIGATAEHPR